MAPRFATRRPETGPAARRTTPNRMAARLIEIIEAAEILSGRRTIDPTRWLTIHRPAPGIGCGVVESPRGRLYYRVERADDGTIGWLDSLAPTEWNFAAGGPLTRLLIGRTVGSIEEASALGRRATGLVDPCVDFAVEAVHA
jgi:coenzyme F420-reducing hydrogenase alpha subunit